MRKIKESKRNEIAINIALMFSTQLYCFRQQRIMITTTTTNQMSSNSGLIRFSICFIVVKASKNNKKQFYLPTVYILFLIYISKVIYRMVCSIQYEINKDQRNFYSFVFFFSLSLYVVLKRPWSRT